MTDNGDAHYEYDRGVEAGREQCAAIARSLISNDTDWDTSYWNQACERIAMAIEMGAVVEPVVPARRA